MRILLRGTLATTTTAGFLAAAALVLSWLLPVAVVVLVVPGADGFHMVMMARRGKGNLKRSLEGSDTVPRRAASLNQGKGQEITGVTLPQEGTIKGWEFGEGERLACCNVDNQFYALQGDCPRCGFDLWRGTLLVDDPAWDDLPRVACPTCATTYSMRTGQYGPPLKRTGLQGFVTGLAKRATSAEANKNAKVYRITQDEDGRVYCRS